MWLNFLPKLFLSTPHLGALILYTERILNTVGKKVVEYFQSADTTMSGTRPGNVIVEVYYRWERVQPNRNASCPITLARRYDILLKMENRQIIDRHRSRTCRPRPHRKTQRRAQGGSPE